MVKQPFGFDVLLTKVAIDELESGFYLPEGMTLKQPTYIVTAFGCGKRDSNGNKLTYDYDIKIGDEVIVEVKNCTALKFKTGNFVITHPDNIIAIMS